MRRARGPFKPRRAAEYVTQGMPKCANLHAPRMRMRQRRLWAMSKSCELDSSTSHIITWKPTEARAALRWPEPAKTSTARCIRIVSMRGTDPEAMAASRRAVSSARERERRNLEDSGSEQTGGTARGSSKTVICDEGAADGAHFTASMRPTIHLPFAFRIAVRESALSEVVRATSFRSGRAFRNASCL